MTEEIIQEFDNLLSLIKIERDEDYKQYETFIKKSSIGEQRAKGICWTPLKITEQGYGLGDYPFIVVERTKQKELPHRFSGGKSVNLFCADENSNEDPINGTVHYVHRDTMKIVFTMDELPRWVQNSRLGVNLDFDQRTYDEMERAIHLLKDNKDPDLKKLCEVIIGQKKQTYDTKHFAIDTPDLNPSQNNAVNNILSSRDVSIIHGPPGTGKTTTLTEAIFHLSKKEKHILVTAPSNAAADLLTEKLANRGLKVLRIGNLSRIDEGIISHTLEHKIEAHSSYGDIKKFKKQALEYRNLAGKFKRNFGKEEREERKSLYKEAKDLAKEAIAIEDFIISDLLKNTHVVTTTLVGSENKYLRGFNFDTVVIDEAAQALEGACWIPIRKAKKIILAGDPFQLPPTVKSQEADKKGLSKTLIEKCIKRLDDVQLLDTQYRMNENIMHFSNSKFYDLKLKAHDSVKTHLVDALENTNPIEFVDTAGCGFEEMRNPESLSLYNPGEYDILAKHLLSLTEQTADSSIGIISPYKEQVVFLKEHLEEYQDRVDINTIDSFQGQERDVIYISLVRCNENGEIGFLKDYRRMNVAMTRAKKKLVIIGDSATLSSDKFYLNFIDYCQDKGFYHSAYEWMY